jgi:anti-sigma regulatory factor (Ser/Thr protein kinase)
MDLILAVNEAATNPLVHGGNEGELRIWRDDRDVVCEVADNGTFQEPLAGRRRPEPDWASGRGVWPMNQLVVRPRRAASHRRRDCGPIAR